MSVAHFLSDVISLFVSLTQFPTCNFHSEKLYIYLIHISSSHLYFLNFRDYRECYHQLQFIGQIFLLPRCFQNWRRMTESLKRFYHLTYNLLIVLLTPSGENIW